MRTPILVGSGGTANEGFENLELFGFKFGPLGVFELFVHRAPFIQPIMEDRLLEFKG